MNLESNQLKFLLIDVVEGAATVYIMIIMIRSLMTWLREDILVRFYKVFEFIARIADPILDFARRFFPVSAGRMDFSPIVALIIVEVVKFIILYIIRLIFRA
jgi:YggT family protein